MNPIGSAFEEAMRRHADDPRAAVRYVLLQSGLAMSRQRAIELALTRTVCSHRTLDAAGMYLYCVAPCNHRGTHHNPKAKPGSAWSR